MTTKEQILETAKMLFFQDGYEHTAIQKIIDEIQIAKGTFYHHFKSKEDLLEAMTDKLIADNIGESINYVLHAKDDAVTKFNRFVNMQSQWKSRQFDFLYMVLKAMYGSPNIILRNMITQKNVIQFSPIFTQIIEQGIAEGVFNTPYPKELSTLLFKISDTESEEIAKIMLNYKAYDDPATDIKKRYAILLNCIERLLGAKPGTFILDDPELIDEFIAYMKERDKP
jgi:AcrR family transcriptional regulator